MTYNICSGMSYGENRKRDLAQSAEVIKEYAPDILALNEVHYNIRFSGFVKQAEEINKLLNYEYMYYGKAGAIKEGFQGNALFSRYPVKTVHTVLVDQPAVLDEDVYYEQRSFIDSVIDIGKDLHVIVTHFGLAEGERKNALDLLIPIFRQHRKSLVFMGDLNLEPHEEQLKSISGILKDTAAISNKKYFTFPSDIPDRKIDYIFVSHDIKVNDIVVPLTTASDHLPYIADVFIG
ncbi:MAG: Endonuclease/Exonuclease/phosphatase family protein [Firmicutes bacterium ADurb.Bin099]|nr:MAG: Endonuclease/Exonuclease/phosphatase family protein [Firmicutes bacterium ADurb.Bin099]